MAEQDAASGANPMIYLASVLAATDDTMRAQFTNDAGSAVVMAFTLMAVQGGTVDSEGKEVPGWMEILEQDRNKFLVDSMGQGQGASALAQADQAQYDIDSSKSDQQTSDWQQIIQATQTQISQDNNSRQGNLSLVDSAFTSQKFGANLVRMSMGAK
jgi:hypothetical protein